MQFEWKCEFHPPKKNGRFNTVNGIRVHAILVEEHPEELPRQLFQYRKRYKGACNSLIRDAEGLVYLSFNTVNGIRVHAMS